MGHTPDTVTITTPAEAAALTPGQWVYADDDSVWCLVDTCIGWPQRMWMAHNNPHTLCVALDAIPYPLALTTPNGPCEHSWGTQECGHCRRCGAVVGEVWAQPASEEELTELRAVLQAVQGSGVSAEARAEIDADSRFVDTQDAVSRYQENPE